MSDEKLRLGMVIDPEYYMLEKSVSAVAIPLARAYLRYFDTRILYDQGMYDRLCTEVDFIVSWEPRWAAPVLQWRRAGLLRRALPPGPCYVMMSDPHNQLWRQDYFLRQKLDYILGLYYQPTLKHFQRIPPEKLVHFPWMIPDAWITDEALVYRGQKDAAIFGASGSEAYTVRNWCRQQPGVQSYDYSGVENKVWSDQDYFTWLKGFDAVIAAGSDNPKFDLTTPKYFEIAAAGCLLFAQHTADLERLGFQDGQNCIVFTKDNFNEKLQEYLADPGNPAYLEIRRAGRELVRQRHTIGVRMKALEEHVRQWKGRS